VQDLISQLTDLLADMQSQLDFSDAEVGSMELNSLLPRFLAISNILESWLNTFRRYRQLFERTVVVFVGEPNAGKSSLFNRLLGIDKAIVHEKPGTTRDYIEHPFEYNGFPFLFVDTAGIRATEDPVEALGIKRSREAMERADIILWISDCYQEPPAQLTGEFSSKTWLKIGSKADLKDGVGRESWLDVSVRTGLGISRIMEALHCSFDDSATVLMSDRQASRVAAALEALKEAERLLKSGEYLDYTTTKVLEASHFMKEIVDEIPNDDVLKSIFSRFCIGK
jgi:tRNA modification GTPase